MENFRAVESIRYYKRKSAAVKAIQNTSKLLANRNITEYFVVSNHQEFLDIINASPTKHFFEFIPDNIPVCFYYDVEIYNGYSDYFDDPKPLLDLCIGKVMALFTNTGYTTKSIILESHDETKKSFHVIFRVYNNETSVMFQNVSIIKNMYKKFGLDSYKDSRGKRLIDPSVYREGLFRTLYSTKTNEKRYLTESAWSDKFQDLESFVTYKNDSFVVFTPETNAPAPADNTDSLEDLTNADKECIIKFVQQTFHHPPQSIREIKIDRTHNCIVVALDVRYCHFVQREHKSNNQYIVIDTSSSKQKCHDTDCNDNRHCEISLEQYPVNISTIIKRCLSVNKHELELINGAITECTDYISENFDGGVKTVQFDEEERVFKGEVTISSPLIQLVRGKCPQCNVEHRVSDGGYCLKCTVCKSIFPPSTIIPVDHSKYKHLSNFWANYQIHTINNIINIYNGGEEDFSCDVQLDANIFRNKELTTLFNQILDGHKVVLIGELMSKIETNFAYANGEWYYFNGSIWKQDKESLEFRKRIVKISQYFQRVQKHYEDKNVGDNLNVSIVKNIKSLINKLHKTGFEDEVIKGGKMYYNDEQFITCLNKKKHLVPFTNGVFDLMKQEFRKATKTDYINLTVSYDYEPQANNPEVHNFINNILPNENVRNYVLKKLSDCLNGDIPNTNFLMFIGDGANGKSQLLNLMKLVMGELGEKVEVTLLTRKRNNANEANTEKIKLMNKRFAFLSEPEDGEKINIGLLKELTGSEEIVARGLYQESQSFVMETKLFLACNDLPEIKGEDTALWRRVRVIDFPSRFVDSPQEPNEYKIDRTLPTRMREDVTWKQTLMNILLEFYQKDILEPKEVQMSTLNYRSDNDVNALFVTQYLQKGGDGIRWGDLYAAYQSWFVEEMGETKKIDRKQLKNYFEKKVFKCKEMPQRGLGRGWVGWSLVQNTLIEDEDDV